jgi:hypothetical protein
MIWFISVTYCVVVLMWGIYWSFDHERAMADIKERITKVEVKVEYLEAERKK